MNLIVSACLLGINCKYSGGNNYQESIAQLSSKYHLIPLCPEHLGGLPTPRKPAEIVGGKVMTQEGQDVTPYFVKGAEESLKIAKLAQCSIAILKSNSPSCGCSTIYDGSFTGVLREGAGITAQLLMTHGITVLSEKDLESRG